MYIASMFKVAASDACNAADVLHRVYEEHCSGRNKRWMYLEEYR
jgi:hypothetical protein